MARAGAGHRRAVRVWLSLLSAMALVATLLALPVGAAPAQKTFTADASPSVWAGGPVEATSAGMCGNDGDGTLDVCITNTTPNQGLGSANVTVPAGLTVTTASATAGTATVVGNVIQLRNLGLTNGETVTVSTDAVADCGQNGRTLIFNMAVKQSNDFNGTGNDLALSGAPAATSMSGDCSLEFTAQPAGAVVDTPITTVPFRSFDEDPVDGVDNDGDGRTDEDPVDGIDNDNDTPPIRVTVRSADDSSVSTTWGGTVQLNLAVNPGSATLTGGNAPTVSGVASFDTATRAPKVNVHSSGYKLGATSTDSGVTITNDPSNPFTIVLAAGPCLTGQSCTASGNNANTTANVDAQADNGDTVFVTVAPASGSGDVTLLSSNCGGLAAESQLVQFEVIDIFGSPGGGVKVVEILLANASKPANKYDVCWAGAVQWTQPNGTPAPLVGGFTDIFGGDLSLHVGLLPDCKDKGRNQVGPSCIESKKKDGGSVRIVVRAPEGDPRGFVG